MKTISFLIAVLLLAGCDDSSKQYDWNNDAGNNTTNNSNDAGSDVLDAGDDGDVIEHTDPPPTIAGVWAQKQILASTVNYPMIGPVDTFHINYIRVEITQDGTRLTATEQTCQIIVEADTDLQTTIIPEAFVNSMDIEPKPARLEPTAQGWRFVQPQYWQVNGVHLTDIPGETLPDDAADPRVFDQDEDGQPGLTVRMTGMLSGELYVISREWTTLTSTDVTASGFEGLIEWEGAQITLGASSDILNTTPESVTHVDPTLSNFKYVPVDAATTCAEISAQKESLFTAK